MQVLVIEDEEDVRLNIVEILESGGFEPIDAADGRVGLAIAQAQHPDLIICDIKMPIVSGFELTKAIRQNFSRDEVKLIMMTAVKDPTSIERAIRMGIHDYIVKPFSPLILIEKVERVLAEKKVG